MINYSNVNYRGRKLALSKHNLERLKKFIENINPAKTINHLAAKFKMSMYRCNSIHSIKNKLGQKLGKKPKGQSFFKKMLESLSQKMMALNSKESV